MSGGEVGSGRNNRSMHRATPSRYAAAAAAAVGAAGPDLEVNVPQTLTKLLKA